LSVSSRSCLSGLLERNDHIADRHAVQGATGPQELLADSAAVGVQIPLIGCRRPAAAADGSVAEACTCKNAPDFLVGGSAEYHQPRPASTEKSSDNEATRFAGFTQANAVALRGPLAAGQCPDDNPTVYTIALDLELFRD
jgi:hypothetical protein